MDIQLRQELKAFTEELARASGELILRYWHEDTFQVDRKADKTPVTDADREAEVLMRKMINERYPEHGIIAEEFPNEREDAEYVWVLDPIDGTKSFVGHVPLFGTLIGLLHQGVPAIGCIHQPLLKELAIGDNETTTLNGEPVRVRACEKLEDAILLTTDPCYIAPPSELDGLKRLAEKAWLTRCWGDCYGYLLVATGRADMMLDPDMAPWDLLPLIPVIKGAGGAITDWQGGEAYLGTSALACSPELQRAALGVLAG
ncbi:MAG: histidinol-phosphatase [Verrucomicrobiota bacterium]